MSSSAAHTKKRLVLCCDGTWMDSDDGYNKPTLIPYVPTGSLQIPSNVTRISRALERVGFDGSPQIIYYHSGVGSGPGFVDAIGGGLLGTGISENIREVYSFVAANYTPGDDIVLIGFSRGAFTARSVAAMIGCMGLLTRSGMSSFYPIFKDYENFLVPHYHDIFPTIPFPDKPKGATAAREYKRRLEQAGLTRIYDPDGSKIHVQAVAVWDTVGSLGIPQISWLARMGMPHSTKEYRFTDTNLTGIIRHAFQALALDEHRGPFSPAVWERTNMHKTTIDLRQVWFPGAHSNVGGGYDDQEIANISLAWMMDQLASIGVSFKDDYIEQIFADSVKYYYSNPKKVRTRLSNIFSRPVMKQWAIEPVYEKHNPIRPWGLGEIYESEIGLYKISGKRVRTPGMNCRADPQTGILTDEYMANTNERIHRCVRVRLELEGLDLDDRGLYKATALQHKGMWRLVQTRSKIDDPIPWNASWGPGAPAPTGAPEDRRWVWEYNGPAEDTPPERILVEEPLGPYERKLILLNKGRSFYRRFLPSKRRRRKSHKSGAGARSPEDDSLIDAPVREEREKERHRDRRSSRYRDDLGVDDVPVFAARENRVRVEKSRSRYTDREEELSLVDSVDRNEGEKIVRRRERERRNGPVLVEEERYKVREKRRDYYERD